jgi:hypothetical protein
MKNEHHSISKRYYIFRHIPATSEDSPDTVMFRDPTGSWYKDFDKANLWADHDFVVKKAKELQAQLQRCTATEKYIVVIGQVTVEVNGMFPLELAQ